MRLPPEFWKVNQTRIKRYQAGVDRIRAAAFRYQAQDITRIQNSFAKFRAQALANPVVDPLRRDTAAILIQSLRQQVTGLAHEVQDTVTDGFRYHIGSAATEQRLFFSSFSLSK